MSKTRIYGGDEADARWFRFYPKAPRWLQWLVMPVAKRMARALVDRAKERGKITSHAYHELHAILDRMFVR